jgi:hypothetical protein
MAQKQSNEAWIANHGGDCDDDVDEERAENGDSWPNQDFLEEYGRTLLGQKFSLPTLVDMCIHLVFMIRHGITNLASRDAMELTACFVAPNKEHPTWAQLQQLLELLAPGPCVMPLCRNECIAFTNAPDFIIGSARRQFQSLDACSVCEAPRLDPSGQLAHVALFVFLVFLLSSFSFFSFFSSMFDLARSNITFRCRCRYAAFLCATL